MRSHANLTCRLRCWQVKRTKSSFYHRMKAGHVDAGAYPSFEADLSHQYAVFPQYAHCFEGDAITPLCTHGKTQEVFDIGKSLYFAQVRAALRLRCNRFCCLGPRLDQCQLPAAHCPLPCRHSAHPQ